MVDEPETPTLDEFLACCEAAFSFLVDDYGFQRLATPREYNNYSVRYRKGELGVDIYGEGWGKYASCDLLLGDAELSPGLLIPASQRTQPARRKKPLGQLDQIRLIAETLKIHAADFLSGDLRRFDAALAEWRRITRHRPVTAAHRLERERQQAFMAAGHASKRGDHAEVVRLLEPFEDHLSLHQRRMLATSREKLRAGP